VKIALIYKLYKTYFHEQYFVKFSNLE